MVVMAAVFSSVRSRLKVSPAFTLTVRLPSMGCAAMKVKSSSAVAKLRRPCPSPSRKKVPLTRQVLSSLMSTVIMATSVPIRPRAVSVTS